MTAFPDYFFLELTRNCNLYCTMCRPKPLISSDWIMSDEILEQATAIISRYGKVVDLRGWGESTLDDRLLPLAASFWEKGILTRLYSNLNAKDSHFWEALAKTNISIAVSIETAEPELYEKLRRGGKLKQVETHLERFCSTVRENRQNNYPYLTVVVSEDNIHHLNSLVVFAANYGLQEIELNPINVSDPTMPSGRRNGFRPETAPIAIARLKELCEKSAEKNLRVTVAASLFGENPISPKICIHPWKYCCICFDGTVTFCDHLLHNKAAVMGNISKNSFEDIWLSEPYMQLREEHAAGSYDRLTSCGIECEWCATNRFGNSEWLIAPGFQPIDLAHYLSLLELNPV